MKLVKSEQIGRACNIVKQTGWGLAESDSDGEEDTSNSRNELAELITRTMTSIFTGRRDLASVVSAAKKRLEPRLQLDKMQRNVQ